jgi:hypothetical protein
MPPLFNIPFPDGIVRHEIFEWNRASSWYSGSWESVYFDIIYTDSIIQRFKIIIKPDLSDVSLHVINMSEFVSDGLLKYPESEDDHNVCDGYRLCEDALVYFWINGRTWGAYAGLTSAPCTNVVTRLNGHINSLCPTSGRFVYHTDDSDGIAVVDLF